MIQTTISVKGMACDGCANSVKTSLEAVDGVSDASVDLAGQCAEVTFDEARAPIEKLLAAVRDAGYEPSST